jgi:peptide/nickel transport system permease protein
MRLRANAAIGAIVIGGLAFVAIVAAFWTPYDPLVIDLKARLHSPSPPHWLGTDEFGRDILSRVMAGASASALVAASVVASATVFGAAIGLVCGYLRGAVDRLVMTITDAFLAFPAILLALAALVVLGAGRAAIILALSLAYAPSTARIVRGAALSVREREFVEASRLMGNSEAYTMLRHVLPNCLAPLIVLATSMFGWALLAESALSFLGLGVQPPAPTWGNMLADSRPFMRSAPWLEIAPGLCIALTLLGANLLGDALRDRLDPRMRPV